MRGIRRLFGTARGRLLVLALAGLVVFAPVVAVLRAPTRPPGPEGKTPPLAPPAQSLIVSAAYVRDNGGGGASWAHSRPRSSPPRKTNGRSWKALSPTKRLDPCAADTRPNLALGKPVVVSSLLQGSQGSWAVDGLALSDWSAGDFAPQSITIDFGGPITVRELRLLTSQFPAGHTTHSVELRTPTGAWNLAHTFDGTTAGDQWLRWFPKTPIAGIRYLRVTTTDSPSWVAWREIQVY